MVFIGGRARMMSARSRPASISTRKPSRFWSRGSAWVWGALMNQTFGWCGSKGCGGHLFGLVFARNEFSAQKLADGRLRDLANKDVAARPLEIGEPRGPAMVVEVTVGDLGTPLDESGDNLAPPLVRQADHGDLRDGGMKRQTALDLDRRDILAAGDDHVIDASRDVDVPVLVRIAGIAGQVPTLAERLGVCFGALPIAPENFAAGGESRNFAFLTRRGNLVRVARAQLHDPDHLVDAGPSRRARFPGGILVDREGVDF